MEKLTTKEAAEYLGIAHSTLRTYVQVGKIKPVDTVRKGRGAATYLFDKSDLDKMITNKPWGDNNDNENFGRSHSKYTDRCDRPRKDQLLENGCVIHWTRRYRQNEHTYVPVTCADCKEMFSKLDQTLWQSLQNGSFTGCCSLCAPLHKRPVTMVGRGRCIRSDGYIHRHIRTFTEEEAKIIEPMLNGCYVQEHRAIVALQIGRSLSINESVHHINGDKQDNRPENLILYDKSTHSREHIKLYNNLIELENEVERLKGILEQNNIPY